MTKEREDMPRIEPGMTLREVIARYPSTARVFDRYGLMGCGGLGGPIEPLDWFARVHKVDLANLLDELRAAAQGRLEETEDPPPLDRAAGMPDLYRRFLKAALLFTLTGGTALGAWALFMMGLRGELGGLSPGVIQVHGHFQLFGWVGLFVIGVAYHILPRLTGIPISSRRLASGSFVLLVGGILLRMAQPLDPSSARASLLIGAALMELAGCAIFAWIVCRILWMQPRGLHLYQEYLAIGTGWLLLSALLNLGHTIHLVAAGARVVAPFLNVPYLTLFLLGFVTFWILGVSLRTIPAFMALGDRPRLASILLLPLTLSVAALAAGEGFYLGAGDRLARMTFGAGGIGVGGSLVLFAWALGILGRPKESIEKGIDRGYEKFIRLGYAWLVASGLMLGIFSILTLLGRDIDHALVGAYRHALTVGFITTVMVGMASRIVPVFSGVPIHSTRLRDWTFWLLAIGNLIRVLFQSLSVWGGPVWLRIAGISGVIELVALFLFGVNIWRTLGAGADVFTEAKGPPPIASETRVGELLAAYPDLLPVFLTSGFTALANPILRRTVARGISIGQACRLHGIDETRFLGQLTAARGNRSP
jgi:hypothetical protein